MKLSMALARVRRLEKEDGWQRRQPIPGLLPEDNRAREINDILRQRRTRRMLDKMIREAPDGGINPR